MTYIPRKPEDFDPSLRIGEKLPDNRHGWRSIYPIFKNDDLIAFLGFPAGFRGKWTLYAIQPSEAPYAFQGYSLHDHYSSKVTVSLGRDYALNELTLSLKTASEKYGVKFPSKTDQDASQEAAKAARMEEAANWQRIRKTAQDARETRLTGLRAILSRVPDLVEAERFALSRTIELLQAEIDHYARQIAVNA